MRSLIWENPLAKAVILLVLIGLGSIVVASSLTSDKDNTIGGVSDLRDWFISQQEFFLRIAPPSDFVFLQTGYPEALAFDPDDMPLSMLQEMTGQVEYDCPVYQLYLVEDPDTRDFVIFNQDVEEIYSIEADVDYDPTDYALSRYPDLYSGAYTSEEISDILATCDPARIQISVRLVSEEFYSSYISASQQTVLDAQAALLSASGGGIMMMSSSSSDLAITNIAPAGGIFTNGIEITVQVPVGFTNNVEIFATTNLVDTNWQPVYTNNVTPGETNFVWVDEGSSNRTYRYYTAANADLDTDEDTLTDARELLLYGTDPQSADTDGDFMDDAWELLHSFDPNDDLDMILDPDHDMLPNVYEYHYGLNPLSDDSDQVVKLRVDPPHATESNTYVSIRDAFAASSPYSVIEIAPGVYSGYDNTGLDFPDHPVLMMSDDWGIDRGVEIQCEKAIAFMLGNEQDNRTILRGLNLDLTGTSPIQIGFYLGEGVAPFSGAAPFFDGVQVTMGQSDWTIGVYGLGPSDKTVRFNNCILRGPGGQNTLSGIYLVNAPSVHIANCSFLAFNSASSTSPGIALGIAEGDAGQAAIHNCLWDASFGANNNYAVAHLGDSGDRYQTEVSYTIAPNVGYFLDVDSISSMTQTCEVALLDGLILSNSSCIDAAGIAPLTWYDFHGQVRDATPDIGADEYSAISTNSDTDADGLTDSEEAFEYSTSIFDADTDNDGVGDGDEVVCGTQPTNRENYCVTILGDVDDRTGLSATIRASYDLGTETWNADNATEVDNGEFTYADQIIDSPYRVVVQVLVDLDGDNTPDNNEPYYTKTLTVTNHTTAISFVLEDADGDGVGDADEVACGVDPNHRDHYCVTLQGTVTDQSGQTGTLYAAAVLIDRTAPLYPGQLASGAYESTLLQQVTVATNGSFLIDDLIVDQRSSNEVWKLWLHIYQDINTNATMEHYEPNEQIPVNVTNHTLFFDVLISTNSVDLDGDLIPDWWEVLNGLSYTNRADRFADFDGDWIDNKWEYDLGLDPNSYDTNNYAFADAMRAVDSRIAGKDPATAIQIYSLQNHAAGIYERNTNCWAADIDLTSCSPWNSQNSANRAGTLISPRHALFVNHIWANQSYWLAAGHSLRFVDATNGVYTATVDAVHHLDTQHADLTVAVLIDDVPTNRFSYVKVLPNDYTNYLGQVDIHVPGLCLDQQERALIHDLDAIRAIVSTNITYVAQDCSYRLPIYASRTNYFDSTVDSKGGPGMRRGDSGNPAFIIFDNEPILTTLWVSGGGGSGSAVSNFKAEINAILAQQGGHSLAVADLSSYDEIPEPLR